MITFNFHRTNTPLGRAIRFFSGGMVNHVSIQIGNWIWEADFKRGVIKTDISKWEKQHQVVKTFDIFTPYESTIKYWLDRQVGKKYDWFGVLSFVWAGFGERRGYWFCSELGAVVFAKALNMYGFNQRQSPQNLLDNLTTYEYARN